MICTLYGTLGCEWLKMFYWELHRHSNCQVSSLSLSITHRIRSICQSYSHSRLSTLKSYHIVLISKSLQTRTYSKVIDSESTYRPSWLTVFTDLPVCYITSPCYYFLEINKSIHFSFIPGASWSGSFIHLHWHRTQRSLCVSWCLCNETKD